MHSPLSRAADTAAIVADLRWPLRADAGLLEAHLGELQGQPEGDPSKPSIREWVSGTEILGAESYEALKLRVARAVAAILSECERPLLVAHAGVYHALRDVMGAPVGRVHHCVPYAHEPDGAMWRIREIEP